MKNLFLRLSIGLIFGSLLLLPRGHAQDCVLIKKNQTTRGKVCVTKSALSVSGKDRNKTFSSKINFKNQTITVLGNIQDFLEILSPEISQEFTENFLVVGLNLSTNSMGKVILSPYNGFLIANGVYYSYEKLNPSKQK